MRSEPSVRCEDVADALPGAVDASAPLDAAARAHVETCLRCQAELVQYRRLLRALRALRTEVLEPAPGMLAEVLGAVSAAGERHAVRSLLGGRRAAYVGGVAAAATAGAVGALVLAQRNRRPDRSVRLAG